MFCPGEYRGRAGDHKSLYLSPGQDSRPRPATLAPTGAEFPPEGWRGTLTSTHNSPPAAAKKGKRRFLGITCPPGRVPQTPSGELRPLIPVPQTGFPLLMSGCQPQMVDISILTCL